MQQKEIDEKAEKFNIDLRALEQEQKKLTKLLSIKDSFEKDEISRVAGVETISIGNKIIVGIIVLQDDEVVEQRFVSEKTSFPYFPGFRAYRELPAILACFEQVEVKPNLIFVKGQGIIHPRGLGIASHLSLSLSIPVIGITDDIPKNFGEIKGDSVFFDKKAVGKILNVKEGARPLYVSPGNLISVKTASELTLKFIKAPHKMPEPLRLARNLVKKVVRELN